MVKLRMTIAPFPEYEEFRSYIESNETRAAFEYLVAEADRLVGFECGPRPHGAVKRNFQYIRNGRAVFSFILAKKWLRCYLAAMDAVRPGLSISVLRDHFQQIEANGRNGVKFRISSVEEAKAIIELVFGLKAISQDFSYPDEIENPELLVEGAAQTVAVNRYERNSVARGKCIQHYGNTCIVCGFSFERFYGITGEGYIHVHHLVELSSIGREYTVDPIKDLRPVCANCHAMLHRRSPAYTIDELKNMISNREHPATST